MKAISAITATCKWSEIKDIYSCFVLKPCEITNLIYFFFVLGGHYPLLLEVDADEKEKMFMIISSLEHFTI